MSENTKLVLNNGKIIEQQVRADFDFNASILAEVCFFQFGDFFFFNLFEI